MKKWIVVILLLELLNVGVMRYKFTTPKEKHVGAFISMGCSQVDITVCLLQHPDNSITVAHFNLYGPPAGVEMKDLIYRDIDDRQEIVKMVPKEIKEPTK